MTPDNATSPMDSSSTVRIPRETVRGADRDDLDPESTVVIPNSSARDGVQWPAEWDQDPRRQDPQGQDPQAQNGGRCGAERDLPPNPYQGRRAPGEFGPLGSRAANEYPRQ